MCPKGHKMLPMGARPRHSMVTATKAHNIRALEDMSPRRLEPCGNFKHSGPVTRLFAPRPKDSHCLVIERHVTCLTSLGIGALDSEEPMGEIDGFPSEFQEFISPKSRVYGNENRGRHMVPVVRERRNELPPPPPSPPTCL